jgi:hypothetical protein
MKQYSDLLGFGLCPSSDILNNYKTQCFGNWIYFHPQGFSSFLEFQMMDKVQKPSNSACYTSLSEPFRLYMKQYIKIS